MFSILGASLLAFVLSRMNWTKLIPFKRLLLFSWLALFTHMLLDAFTAYGTQLFLPFSNYRVSFDSVNIVDPAYTLPLLIGLIITIYHQAKNKIWSIANIIGIIISSIYLIFTLGHKQHVANFVKAELINQKIKYNSIGNIPVGAANINWHGVAKVMIPCT